MEQFVRMFITFTHDGRQLLRERENDRRSVGGRDRVRSIITFVAVFIIHVGTWGGIIDYAINFYSTKDVSPSTLLVQYMGCYTREYAN